MGLGKTLQTLGLILKNLPKGCSFPITTTGTANVPMATLMPEDSYR